MTFDDPTPPDTSFHDNAPSPAPSHHYQFSVTIDSLDMIDEPHHLDLTMALLPVFPDLSHITVTNFRKVPG